jgi:hypothetical protein
LITYEKHAVDVMDITMFPATIMDVVLWHGDFGAVEHRRLEGVSIEFDK